MELEGIILSKTKFKERHLVCRLLTRSSSKVSVLFYGGQGGGKKNKPSLLEVGNLINLTAKNNKNYSDLKSVSEWKIKWGHEKVKKNYKAYFLLSFFLEVIDKVSFDDGNEYEVNHESESLFKLLSNGIYYLEKSVDSNSFVAEQHLSLFLGKLIYYLGIYPNLDSCFYCNKDLSAKVVTSFQPQDGGFVCQDCQTGKMGEVKHCQDLWELLRSAKKTSYKSYTNIGNGSRNALETAFEYFLGQFQLSKSQVKSSSFVFH